MWISAAIISYFLNAFVYAADKFLLSKKIHSSITYAFYVGVWSIFNIFLLILDPWIPPLRFLLLDLTAGLLFMATLILWYKALHQSEATRVVPVVGALIPLFTLILSFVFLGEGLGSQQLIAFVILITGGILISIKRTKFYLLKQVLEKIRIAFSDILGGIHARYRPARRLLINSLLAALFFSSYHVLMKFIYLNQPFIGGFVWSRMGSFLGVIFIFMIPAWRRSIFKHKTGVGRVKNLSFFLAVRIVAAVAFIMLNFAISLGNVALINSLQGVQYLFLIIIVLILSSKFPKILKEELSREIILQKILGIALVSFGLYLLLIS